MTSKNRSIYPFAKSVATWLPFTAVSACCVIGVSQEPAKKDAAKKAAVAVAPGGKQPNPPAAPAAPVPVFKTLAIADGFKTDKQIKDKMKAKDEMLKGSAAYSDRDVLEYYKGYVIPRMTMLDAPETCNESRREFLRTWRKQRRLVTR